ncbi:MAG: DegT/DnrJ/EryC1/StrS family aminotransferase [Acidobacteriota bacterium]|nr:DegT/DnrJ/EryC1/StrS family aminotransferase [Acidobacteriota bacterium]
MKMIPVAKPWMDEREAAAASRPILAGWVTQGPEVAAFEKEFAEAVGAKYACAVSNCTTALHLALRAVGVEPGDEVITVSHSFVATASSIRYCGATPVFIDIDSETYNLDPARIEWAVTPRTKAILCVHQMGMPCDMAKILAVASRYSLPLIEDAACAAGSELLWNGRFEKIGKPHGAVACFSFHPRKVITTGDGGMLTTADPKLDAQFRLWRQHSMSVPDTVRHKSNQIIFEEYPELGFNYRMTDIQAAVGREQLKRLPEMVERRRQLAETYNELLSSVEGQRSPSEPHYARSNWQSYCIRLDKGIDQRKVMQSMLEDGIATRRGIMCAHREPAYSAPGSWLCGAAGCRTHANRCGHLGESELAQDEAIILPLFHGMILDEQRAVVSALRSALAKSTVLTAAGESLA